MQFQNPLPDHFLCVFLFRILYQSSIAIIPVIHFSRWWRRLKLPSDVGKTVDAHKCVLKHFWRFRELPLLSFTRRAKPRQNAPERYFCGFYRPGSALSYLHGLYDIMTVPWLDRSICECIALCLWNRNNITGPAEGKQHGTA